jgi:Alcohol dehydrogenase GroES-like domain
MEKARAPFYFHTVVGGGHNPYFGLTYNARADNFDAGGGGIGLFEDRAVESLIFAFFRITFWKSGKRSSKASARLRRRDRPLRGRKTVDWTLTQLGRSPRRLQSYRTERGYMFKAWLITKADTQQTAALTQLDEGQLPEGDVTVRIENSSINYKDALALTGKAPIIRRFPMIPGIDLGGIVEQSRNHNYHSGDKVVVNGWEIGEVHWGGLSELARLRSEWLIKLPEPRALAEALVVLQLAFSQNSL